jgi:predicted PurR-regulated permease PerM
MAARAARDKPIRVTTASQIVNNSEDFVVHRFGSPPPPSTMWPAMRLREDLVGGFTLLSLAGLLYVVVRLLLPFAQPILWATILAVVFYPAYRLLLRGLPRYPSLAAGVMTILILVAVVVPSLMMTGLLARQTVDGYRQLSAYVASGKLASLNAATEHWAIAPLWSWVQERVAQGEVSLAGVVLAAARWSSEFAATHAAAFARNVLGFVVGLAIMLFTLFFAFRDGVAMISSIESAVPLAAADRQRVLERMQQTVLAVVQGMTITAAAQGFLLGVGAWLVGFPYGALLGTMAFALAFVPGGVTLVWLPAAIAALFAGNYGQAAAFAIYNILIVGTVDNFIRPLVIGPQLQLSTPLLMFGILGGLKLYGIIGLFLGPAVLALFAVVLSIYRERILAEHSPG